MPALTPKELRTRRLLLGWTKEQLAAKLAVSVEQVSAWESGDASIDCTDAIERVFVDAEVEARRA
jgi:transcriptional regulator with XRE-family HTH domain